MTFRFNPYKGEYVNPEKCVASVMSDGWHSCQCSNKRKYGEWCGVHDPEAVERRDKKRQEAWDAQRKIRAKRFVTNHHQACVRLVERLAKEAMVGSGPLRPFIREARALVEEEK